MELNYKGASLGNEHYMELYKNDHFMNIFLLFLVKFHGKNIWEPLHDHVIYKFVL